MQSFICAYDQAHETLRRSGVIINVSRCSILAAEWLVINRDSNN